MSILNSFDACNYSILVIRVIADSLFFHDLVQDPLHLLLQQSHQLHLHFLTQVPLLLEFLSKSLSSVSLVHDQSLDTIGSKIHINVENGLLVPWVALGWALFVFVIVLDAEDLPTLVMSICPSHITIPILRVVHRLYLLVSLLLMLGI